MRRLLPLALLFPLLVPATAAAMRMLPGDGTLTVRNGHGFLRLELTRGVAIGRIEGGVLEVVTPDGDCSALDVWGADAERPVVRVRVDGTEIACRFEERLRGGTAAAIRFRIEQPRTTIRIHRGVQFAVAAVGRGSGFIRGAGGLEDGVYAANGDEVASLPDDGRRFILGTLTP